MTRSLACLPIPLLPLNGIYLPGNRGREGPGGFTIQKDCILPGDRQDPQTQREKAVHGTTPSPVSPPE